MPDVVRERMNKLNELSVIGNNCGPFFMSTKTIMKVVHPIDPSLEGRTICY